LFFGEGREHTMGERRYKSSLGGMGRGVRAGREQQLAHKKYCHKCSPNYLIEGKQRKEIGKDGETRGMVAYLIVTSLKSTRV